MTGHTFHLRIMGPTALTSLLLLALCAFVSVYLYRQQTVSAEELGENIGSRRAASNLEETLRDLAAYHRRGNVHVEPLHEQIDRLLAEIEKYADKPQEQDLAARLVASYRDYQRVWHAPPAANDSG